MRARIRLSILLPCSLVLLLAAFLPLQAQIQGVAPSVTSFGFGGSNNPTPGIPASVTSLGPDGFGNSAHCCYGPSFSNRPAFGDHRGHDHHQYPLSVMPVYVPYAVPYPVYAEADTADDSGDIDYTYSRGVPRVYERGPWSRDLPAPRKAVPEPKAVAAASPQPDPDPPAGVPDQPSTVLVYKNGHKSDVRNYAIVGETLFDLTEGRSRKIPLADLDLPATQKANEDNGLDFQIPAKSPQASQKK